MSHPTISSFNDLSLPAHTKVVLLDLDNTCYEYEPCHTVALTAVRSALEEAYGPLPDFTERYQRAQKEVKGQIPTHGASHSRILYFQHLLEELAAPTLLPVALSLETLYWDTFIPAMRPTIGLHTFLAQCHQNGTKVVVVSDLTTAIQCRKIEVLGLSTFITTMVTSEEAGAEKPDAAPFLLALKKAQCVAKDAVMIGDSYEKDIVGATTLNIPAIQFLHETTSAPLPARSSRHL